VVTSKEIFICKLLRKTPTLSGD